MMNERGQLSIEYLLVLIMMFSYLNVIIFPVMDLSTKSAQDVSNFASAKFASDKLASAIDQICTGAEFSTRWIIIDVPSSVTMNYDSIAPDDPDKGATQITFSMDSAFKGTGSQEDISIEGVCDNDEKTCTGEVYADCLIVDPTNENELERDLVGGTRYRLQLVKRSETNKVSLEAVSD